MYKVFLVEDEIVTREGIRNSVDWTSAGFHFCGEAADGEVALPLIREHQPEIVITDIKMPFMDGLQLCRLLKESLPDTKILILSGHDEFKYAQEAIQIGVTEYLLKPISAQELLAALHNVAQQVDQEQQAAAQLQSLQAHMADYRSLLRDRCLLNLVFGTMAVPELLEQCRMLELNLLALWYLVLVIRVSPSGSHLPSSRAFQSADARMAQIFDEAGHTLHFKKDLEETVLILKGVNSDDLQRESQQLSDRVRQQLEQSGNYQVAIGIGAPTERIGAVSQSFFQALAQLDLKTGKASISPVSNSVQRFEFLKPDASVMMRLLRSGVSSDCDQFFAAYLAPLGQLDNSSRNLINYAFTDAVLSSAGFLRELGAEPETILPELNQLDVLLDTIQDFDHAKVLIWQILQRVLSYRDSQTHHQRLLVAKAKSYIDAHYAGPDISLSAVAAHVTLSPSYFSVVFAREVGETFIEYLTKVRICKAMELLRTRPITSSEIAYQVGYHNPRYFHSVFRKVVGISPTEFRRQTR